FARKGLPPQVSRLDGCRGLSAASWGCVDQHKITFGGSRPRQNFGQVPLGRELNKRQLPLGLVLPATLAPCVGVLLRVHVENEDGKASGGGGGPEVLGDRRFADAPLIDGHGDDLHVQKPPVANVRLCGCAILHLCTIPQGQVKKSLSQGQILHLCTVALLHPCASPF